MYARTGTGVATGVLPFTGTQMLGMSVAWQLLIGVAGVMVGMTLLRMSRRRTA